MDVAHLPSLLIVELDSQVAELGEVNLKSATAIIYVLTIQALHTKKEGVIACAKQLLYIDIH